MATSKFFMYNLKIGEWEELSSMADIDRTIEELDLNPEDTIVYKGKPVLETKKYMLRGE